MRDEQEPGKQAHRRPIDPDHAGHQPDNETACSPPKIGLGPLSKSKSTAGERYDSYSGALFDIPGTRYRVAVCPQGYQWILQYRRARNHWESLKFFATKTRLATVIREMFREDAYRSVSEKIDQLPI